jgi:lipopolysaccharide transport system ATP-binding protein
VRLAFAVAAHLEPEILLVDEVLAVGDTAFQKKCLGKMSQVAGEGRTVLFVSHNMSAVTRLCTNSILLEHGQIAYCGASQDTVAHYLSRGEVGKTRVDLKGYAQRTGKGDVRVGWVELRNSEGVPACRFTIGETLEILIGLEVMEPSPNKSIVVSVSARTADGIRLFDMVNIDRVFPIIADKRSITLALRVPDVRFYPGTYYLSVWIADRLAQVEFDHVQDILGFEMVDGGRLTVRAMPRNALIFLTPEWMVLDGVSSAVLHSVI